MSVLSFSSTEPAIDTFYDLARVVSQKGYKCGCLKGTINCDTMLVIVTVKIYFIILSVFRKHHFDFRYGLYLRDISFSRWVKDEWENVFFLLKYTFKSQKGTLLEFLWVLSTMPYGK